MAGEVLNNYRDGFVYLLGMTRTNKNIKLTTFDKEAGNSRPVFYTPNRYSELVCDYIALIETMRKDTNFSRRIGIETSVPDLLEGDESFDLYATEEEIKLDSETLKRAFRTLLEGLILCAPDGSHYLREAYESLSASYVDFVHKNNRPVRVRKTRGHTKRAS